MKKLFLLLLIITAFFACKKDSPKTDNIALLTGKWYAQQDTVITDQNGSKSISLAVGAGTIDTNKYILFGSDGIGNRSLGKNITLQPFSFSVKSDTLALNFFSVYSPGIIYTYTQPVTLKWAIKKLTSNNLVLYYNAPSAPNTYSEETVYYIKM